MDLINDETIVVIDNILILSKYYSVDLIDDDECDRRHITSVLPVSTDTIPFFWSCDENIGFLESFEIKGDVSGELEDVFLEWSLFKALFSNLRFSLLPEL